MEYKWKNANTWCLRLCRLGCAELAMGEWNKAAEALSAGLRLTPDNRDMVHMNPTLLSLTYHSTGLQLTWKEWLLISPALGQAGVC